jgi:hypothetical protein
MDPTDELIIKSKYLFIFYYLFYYIKLSLLD